MDIIDVSMLCILGSLVIGSFCLAISFQNNKIAFLYEELEVIRKKFNSFMVSSSNDEGRQTAKIKKIQQELKELTEFINKNREYNEEHFKEHEESHEHLENAFLQLKEDIKQQHNSLSNDISILENKINRLIVLHRKHLPDLIKGDSK